MPKNINKLKEKQTFLWGPLNSLPHPAFVLMESEEDLAQKGETVSLVQYPLSAACRVDKAVGLLRDVLPLPISLIPLFCFIPFREKIQKGLLTLIEEVPEGFKHMQKGIEKVQIAVPPSGHSYTGSV